MTETFSGKGEFDGEIPLDRTLIVGRLQELGVEIEFEDLEGEDDEDVMGLIVTYSTMYDFDMDEVLPEVTPIESRTKNDLGLTLAEIHGEGEEEGGNDEV